MYFSQESYGKAEPKLTRRNFLKLGVLTAVASISPLPSFAAPSNPFTSEKNLSFYNIHNDERLSTVYWRNGQYLPDVLRAINYIMRDHRTNEIKVIQVQLLDLLYDIHRNLNTKQFFHIVSGYRSPATNNYLYKHSTGVNKNSLHVNGMAVDIRIPLCDLAFLGNTAKSLKRGGVGLYPESNFVHVDVGAVRYW